MDLRYAPVPQLAGEAFPSRSGGLLRATTSLLLVCTGLVVGCAAVESIEPSGDASACERAKPDNAECAVVYECARALWDPERGFRHVELCVRDVDIDSAQDMNGTCWPSQDERFKPYTLAMVEPPCFWCCGAGCGLGCNAFDGCYCPMTVPPLNAL
jgi:hypothetical protein